MTTYKRIGPKKYDHPSVGKKCPACGMEIIAGDYTAFIPLGPGNDPANQVRAKRGLTYNPVSVEIHFACATGELDRVDRSARLQSHKQFPRKQAV